MSRSDNFNRANGPIGTPSDGGSAWAGSSSGYVIESTQVKATGNFSVTWLEASLSDAKAQATYVSGNDFGLVGRLLDSNNYWLFHADLGLATYSLHKLVGGVSTTFGTGLGHASPGDVVALEGQGTKVRGIVNGIELISVDDPDLETSTKWGLRFALDTIGDDFSVTPPAAGDGADALEDQLAEAIAFELNSASRPWAPLFTAETATAVRTRKPWYQASELETLQVAVVPLTIERRRLARCGARRMLDYGISVDLQRMIEPEDDATLKKFSAAAELIHDYFDDGHPLVTKPDWFCLSAERKDVYSLVQLFNDRTWETVIAVTVQGFKA